MKSILIRVCLLVICLSSLVNTSKAQNPTLGEIYNFEAGDEFHFEQYVWGYGDKKWDNFKQQVLSKDTQNGILEYRLGREFVSGKVDTVSISIPLDSLSKAMADTGEFYSTYWKPVPVKKCLAVDWLTLFNSERILKLTSMDSSLSTLPDSIIRDGASYYDFFGNGLGQTSYYISGLNGEQKADLVYYKKGNLTWGSPLSVLEQSKYSVTVYPNPSVRVFKISGLKGKADIVVYDLQGQLLHNQKMEGGILDLSHLPLGMFILTIQAKNGEARTTKRIQILRP
jgi:hypothetical protein